MGAAPMFDLVVLSGDLLDREEDAPAVRAVLRRIDVPLAVCSGNHEGEIGTDWVMPRRHLWRDGEKFVLGGWRFSCIPWGEPVPFGTPDDVFIAHAPPAGTKTSINPYGIDHGDFEFGDICARGHGPAIAFTGHVHDAQAWIATVGRTVVFNPRSRDTTTPAYIAADLRAGHAQRHWPGNNHLLPSFRATYNSS